MQADLLRTIPVSHLPLPAQKQSTGWRARGQCALASAVVVAVAAWCYFPTLVALVRAWDREPDYSHGFFVAPLALVFLWARRDCFPAPGNSPRAWGWLLIALGLAMRWAGAHYYLAALDGWSIAIWLGGVVGVLAGWRIFVWALPSLAFLFLAVPLPFSAEKALSLPLQHVAAVVSCWCLQMLGEPALAMGNTILVNEHRLEVEQACSGLRIFVGIAAVAYACIILVRRSWWENCLLAIAVVPIAVISNAARIVVTAVMYQHVSVEAGKKFAHDAAGLAMIVLAFALFGLLLWYLKWLVHEYKVVDVGDLIMHDQVADVDDIHREPIAR